MIAMLFPNSAEQGHPAVAFNPGTREYLVAWHISAPVLQGGAHVIVGQRVHGNQTVRKSNPFVLANAKPSNGFRPVTEPELIYNSASGE